MSNNIFDGMLVYEAVVAENGFGAAAKKLGMSAPHVSREIARLEDRLGTRLLNRTTRHLSMTESGQIYFEQVRQIITDAKRAQSQLFDKQSKPFGMLRISAPASFCRSHLNAWLPEFLQLYPDINLDLDTSDRRADLVAEGLDAVLRIGVLDEAELIARKLGASKILTVASPDYLARSGIPQHPDDLKQHALIACLGGKSGASWRFVSLDGDELKLTLKPRVICNGTETAVKLALDNTGITRVPDISCQAEIANGGLVTLLTDFNCPAVSIHALYPSRSHLAAKTRAFIDFLEMKFRTCQPTE
ncbi:MAG: LysR family transcriptional regulator [Hyphomicrobiales bacterium]|nr:MAG: LysR family transcriptional regulator [Hyphomicrobiales bacterium]